MNNNVFKIIILISSLLLVLFITTKKIRYDWDLPAYVGCVYGYDNSNEQVHKKTYDLLKKQSSKEDYANMTSGNDNGYRNYMSLNSESFNQQLPYFKVKILYISVIKFITLFDLNIIDSIYFINFCSIFLIGILIFYLLYKDYQFSFHISLLLTLSIVFAFQFLGLYQNASPDLMSYLIFIILYLSFVKDKNFWFQIFLMLLMILVRPDSIIFSIIFIIFSGYIQSIKFNKIIIAIVVSLLLYFLIVKTFNYPGWTSLFYDTFIERRIDLTRQVSFTFDTYLNIVITNILNFKKTSFILILLLTINFIKWKFYKFQIKYFFLSIVLFACVYLKFFLFPSPEIRFHLPFILLLILITIKPVGLLTAKFLKLFGYKTD